MSGQNALPLGSMGSFEVSHPTQDNSTERMEKVLAGERKSPVENMNENFLKMYTEKISEAANLAQMYLAALNQINMHVAKSNSPRDILKVEERQKAVKTTLTKIVAHQRATISRLQE